MTQQQKKKLLLAGLILTILICGGGFFYWMSNLDGQKAASFIMPAVFLVPTFSALLFLNRKRK